ncbi:hypothetical protein, partial [Xanthomonas campestris]|uniref:hypothetical protein n=1 Tax=Xanthomonas campestris TaxID=339 RepID=UPI002B228AAF
QLHGSLLNIRRVVSRICGALFRGSLGQMRSAAIGGGSFSAAIVLVLLQVKLTSVALHVSFAAAALGIPIWIVVWQYVQPYLLYGPDSYAHFRKVGSIGVATGLAIAGLITLFVSFSALLWHMSLWVALVFSLFSLAAVIVIARHGQSVLTAVKLVDNGPSA